MNIPKTIPMTLNGSLKLKQELHQLKTMERPKVIQAIAEARANGDLKENADYQAAREQQAFIEGRILDLENKLSNSQVIDVSKIYNDGKIIFGATVTLSVIKDQIGHKSETDANINKIVKYQIVGDEEADLKQHKVSISSPVARGLIGKYEGDLVEIKAPSGIVGYEIEKVEYI